MSLLEVIKKASANPESRDSPSDYPIVLNSVPILPNLRPQVEDVSPSLPVIPLAGWSISEVDSYYVDIGKKFLTNLKRKLKDKNFTRHVFLDMLNLYLEKIREKVGYSTQINSLNIGYTQDLIENLGSLMGKDVAALVLEVCVALGVWEVVETLIVKKIAKYSYYLDLVPRLVEKNRSDLLCLCIKHGLELGTSELLCILKYFLNPSKDAFNSMINVREAWESQAQLAIEKTGDSSLSGKVLLAKEASILLMLAYDGFSSSELCLHFLISSTNIDEVMLSSSFSKLNGKEMKCLIRYIAKWLKKYERFPQAGPCPNASAELGLYACDLVPTLEDVVRCLGLLLDENFSSLVLNPEFHQEIRSVEGVVASLSAEAKICCSMADIVEKVRSELPSRKN